MCVITTTKYTCTDFHNEHIAQGKVSTKHMEVRCKEEKLVD
jgi:hypothetical protein